MRHASWSTVVLAGLCVVLVLPMTASANELLEEAEERVEELDRELAELTEQYELAVAQIEEAVAELEDIEREEIRLGAEVRRMEEDLADRARQVFMQGATSDLNLLLAAADATVAMDRAAYAAIVQNRELAGLEETVAARASLDQLTARASQRRSELLVLQDELRATRAELEAKLEEANDRVELLERVGDRQRLIETGDQNGIYACPLDPSVTHFIDSWGFPRSGGRRHKGTDVMGPMGSPVYAFTDGVIARHTNSRLGGISLYLRGDDGNSYYYAHLQGYAPLGAVGTRVHAGDHIAFNGSTGNASGGAPHIHFERQPGGGSSVNPYPWLARACF